MSSRLCVKGVPTYLTDERLRKLFEAQGSVTDAKVLRTRDGRSRRLAFVGFKDNATAEKACKFFDKSFIDTSKLTVEMATAYGGKDNKHNKKNDSAVSVGESSKTSSVSKNEDKESKIPEKEASKIPEKSSKELDEFLAVVQRRSKAHFWANDAGMTKGDGTEEMDEGPELSSKEKRAARRVLEEEQGDSSSDDDEDDDDDKLETAGETTLAKNKTVSDKDYLSMLKSKTNEDESSDDSSDSSSDSDSEEDEEVKIGKTKKSEKSEKKDGDESESDSDSDSSSSSDSDSDSDSEAETAGSKKKNKLVVDDPFQGTDVSDSGRLFVRNLPFSTTEKELRSIFGDYGPVAEVHVPLDQTKRAKGFAFILFMIPEDAVKAMSALDGTIFQGRLIHVLPAMSRPAWATEGAGSGDAKTQGSEYKDKVEAKRVASAADDTNWNSLFVRSDAAVGALASQLGVTKGDIMDDNAGAIDSLAVRVALSETHVLAQTKKFLDDEGVDLAVLEASVRGGRSSGLQRSDKVILLKNLPEDSNAQELRQLFAKFGALERFVMPPSRTMALVVFYESKPAKNALKGLAYKRYRRVPIYLEWAPSGIFKSDDAVAAANAAASADAAAAGETDAVVESEMGNTETAKSESSEEKTADANATGSVGADGVTTEKSESKTGSSVQAHVVFIKNLNWETTTEDVKAFVGKLVGKKDLVKHVTIPTRKRTQVDGSIEVLSMGYCFVELGSPADATQVVRKCHGKLLAGHELEVRLSERASARVSGGGSSSTKATVTTAQGSSSETGKQGQTKLVVRNLAFEATKTEVRRLFKAHGQVSSLRLPKKHDGTHRGFAFVDMATPQEAKGAFAALANSHLYGRHLVIEWAKDDQSLETLRRKAGDDLKAGESARVVLGQNKRIKFSDDADMDLE